MSFRILSLLPLLAISTAAVASIGTVVMDADGDGYDATADCDDNDYDVHPDAVEINDLKDNDCNGIVDDVTTVDGLTTFGLNSGVDADGDGVDANWDCNDNDANIYPGAPEVFTWDKFPEGVDDDCDGEVDERQDADGDGVYNFECTAWHLAIGDAPMICAGYMPWLTDDCDDSNPNASDPNAAEVPFNGVDDNCDGLIDPHVGDDPPGEQELFELHRISGDNTCVLTYSGNAPRYNLDWDCSGGNGVDLFTDSGFIAALIDGQACVLDAGTTSSYQSGYTTSAKFDCEPTATPEEWSFGAGGSLSARVQNLVAYDSEGPHYSTANGYLHWTSLDIRGTNEYGSPATLYTSGPSLTAIEVTSLDDLHALSESFGAEYVETTGDDETALEENECTLMYAHSDQYSVLACDIGGISEVHVLTMDAEADEGLKVELALASAQVTPTDGVTLAAEAGTAAACASTTCVGAEASYGSAYVTLFEGEAISASFGVTAGIGATADITDGVVTLGVGALLYLEISIDFGALGDVALLVVEGILEGSHDTEICALTLGAICL